MSAAANRPLNWNVLTVDAPRARPGAAPAAGRATGRPSSVGSVVALTMPVQVPMNMSFLNFCGLWLHPRAGSDVLGVPVPERIERLRDPDTRG